MRNERGQGAMAVKTMRCALVAIGMLFGLGCSGTGPSPSSPSCDQACRDAVALRVSLTYVLDHCRYLAADTDPTLNYDITLTGTAIEMGVIAVQPGTTTSLAITSGAMTFSGNVYSPPLPYPEDAAGQDAGAANACAVQVAQNGNQLSGTICGRTAGLTL
jgi:hypothetical protein